MLSAFAIDTALVLAHVDIAEKSNEIPAAQALLADLGVTPVTLVTLDALSKKHFEVAAEANIALIVQIKDNQPTLLQHSEAIATAATSLSTVRSRDKGRNRDESRTVTVFDPGDRLANTGWQDHVATVIRVEREVYTRNTATGLLGRSCETAFYAANIALTAERAADAIRGHWGIENTSHHSRDVTLARTARAFEPIPACSLACAASPSTSSQPARPHRAPKTATVQLSQASITYWL